ncbi:MAG TPA: TolC family protein [Bryobacteraceae bacterium]
MTNARLLAAGLLAAGFAWGQTNSMDPLRYSVATPRPVNPAEGTTNPSAQATQRQNPYLGSVPQKSTGANIDISLNDAVQRGLRYNLGLVDAGHASADVRAARLRALSAMLPQITARGRQAYEDLSLKEIGLKFPPIPGFSGLPATTGGFGFEDARVAVEQSVYSARLRDQYKAQKTEEQASTFDVKDSRDVVVLAVGTAYLQALASEARVEAARARLTSARELDQQTADRVKAETSPEIDALRAQVERQTAEQGITNAMNRLEKDKLTLGRIIGLAVDQPFTLTDTLAYHPLTGLTSESATNDALQSRADLASAQVGLHAAELKLKAEKAQRLPTVSVSANYGAGGANLGNVNQVYALEGDVSIPLYTGGRIRSDIEQAQTEVERRQAAYADLKGRVAYDVRIAWLDAEASDSSVKVAGQNRTLADRALTQSRDRYENGVTNVLEVVQAQETVAVAADNYIDSVYSFDLATVSLARAMGGADTKLKELLGGK